MSMRSRRQRRLADDPKYDPMLSLDLDDYLETYYPDMTTTPRTQVWKQAQKEDTEGLIDWEPIQEQIDIIVEELFGDKYEWIDPDEDEDDLDDESDDSRADDSEDLSDDVSTES